MDILKNLQESWKKLSDNPVALQISSTSTPRQLSIIDERFIYNSAFPGTEASHITCDDTFLYHSVESYLKENGWHKYTQTSDISFPEGKIKDKSQVWLHEEGYLLSLEIAHSTKKKKKHSFDLDLRVEEVIEKASNKETPVLIDFTMLFYPARDIDVKEKISFRENLFNSFNAYYYKESKAANIGIISQDGNESYVKSFSLHGKVPPFIHVDEHYGEGFTEFHHKMVERIKKESKGLILFHGEPGTGKTQYIRMLLDILTRSNKSILYVPPSFSSQLTEPSMIEFISDWVMGEEQDCILLIEDAEPLLEVRKGADGRSTGISNLLNMTDGILNDMLGLMVIATFNTSISKIDSALLRPQRLIARKEFCKISVEQAQRLADALGIPLPGIKYPATLAEFYSESDETNILIHSVKEENRIGFR